MQMSLWVSEAQSLSVNINNPRWLFVLPYPIMSGVRCLIHAHFNFTRNVLRTRGINCKYVLGRWGALMSHCTRFLAVLAAHQTNCHFKKKKQAIKEVVIKDAAWPPHPLTNLPSGGCSPLSRLSNNTECHKSKLWICYCVSDGFLAEGGVLGVGFGRGWVPSSVYGQSVIQRAHTVSIVGASAVRIRPGRGSSRGPPK